MGAPNSSPLHPAGSPVNVLDVETVVVFGVFSDPPGLTPPDEDFIDGVPLLVFTVGTDKAVATITLPKNYHSGGEFKILWTKSQAVSSDQSGNFVSWQITTKTFSSGDGTLIAPTSVTIVNVEDEYESASTTQKFKYEIVSIGIGDSAPGDTLVIEISAETPIDPSAIVAPALISLLFKHKAKTAEQGTESLTGEPL